MLLCVVIHVSGDHDWLECQVDNVRSRAEIQPSTDWLDQLILRMQIPTLKQNNLHILTINY